MSVMKAELDDEQANRLGSFLISGPVELYVEGKCLYVKSPGGHMTITIPLEVQSA